MSAGEKYVVRLSAKGRLILPKSLRRRRDWKVGASFSIEETLNGVLLREAPPFAPTRLEDVFGMLKYAGPLKTIEEMDERVITDAKRRDARLPPSP